MRLPPEFFQSVPSLLGAEGDEFIAALNADPPVSVRLNPGKYKRNPLSISDAMMDGKVAWADSGYYLKERPSFTFDPLFHAGYYYVQEASSMFVEHIVRELVKSPVRCLDLCASPGGKSIALRSVLPDGSLLVSNEIVRQRAHILSENLTKFGHFDVLVCNNSPADFDSLPHFFDLILVDAPCSGEGMFRKDAEAVSEWTVANVKMCAERQRKILSDSWQALKPGGILVYSTCTYNTLENEENVRWIVSEFGARPLSVAVDSSWGVSPSFLPDVTAYRFFPHKTKGEGFFVSAVQKPEDENPIFPQKSKKANYLSVKERFAYNHCLQYPQDFDWVENDNRIVAVSKSIIEPMLFLREKLKVLSFGIELGERKGKDFIPSHALGMSAQLGREGFFMCEISYEDTIAYLRGEALFIDAPKEYVLLTYKQEPIGFVKNIGSRANNLYPQEWRIRSRNCPEKAGAFLS
jgi:16S rRNA C967 or C1407 C5-methylase (RsmB/RsmF family)/NOL1/NOP2/fmu family ribosome biogenesis protein